jgi:hypothetical protein
MNGGNMVKGLNRTTFQRELLDSSHGKRKTGTITKIQGRKNIGTQEYTSFQDNFNGDRLHQWV